jgi:hypothetical protein
MVSRHRQSQALIRELKRRIVARASSGPENVSLAQGSDLAALYDEDPAEFRSIIDKGEMKRRRAYYLLRVGQLLKTGTFTKSDAERIGWTKVQIIADKITGKNVAKLVRLALDNSAQELKRIMREDDQKPAPHCVLMYFSPQQYVQFKRAMILHGATSTGRGLARKEEAIMRLIRPTRRTATP